MPINAIYYTEKLIPVPVELLATFPSRTIVAVRSGARFEVPSHRVIPREQPAYGGVCVRVERRRPKNYLSLEEFLKRHEVALDVDRRQRLGRMCSGTCRRQGIRAWQGVGSLRLFPISIISDCYDYLVKKS